MEVISRSEEAIGRWWLSWSGRCAAAALRQDFENDFELDLVGWPKLDVLGESRDENRVYELI